MSSVDAQQQKKRKYVRKERFSQIAGVADGSRFFATIQNLSLGGMCFDVDYLLKTGQELSLEFKVFDANTKPLEVKAEVVWIEPIYMLFHRVGVVFRPLSPEAKQVINMFVSGLKIPSEVGVSGKERYPLLFTPFSMGNVTLKNRLTMAPMFWGYGNDDGTVSQTLIDKYREIASGGAGMIVVANAVVDETGIMSSGVMRIDDDKYVPGLRKLADTIKSSGTVACLQINHAGRWASVEKPMAPSPVSMEFSPEFNALDGIRKGMSKRHQMRLVNKFLLTLMRCRKAMTIKEISHIKASFGAAAARAKQAGFNMVELHGATGYLLAQFLSPRSNKRKDDYGGSLENRMRFPLEVVEAVKDSVNNEIPVGYRFLADEWLVDGFRPEEAKVFAERLEALGVAYLSVTAGTYESFFLPEIMNQTRKEGYVSTLAGKIKGALSKTPVVVAGRIIGPLIAEEILERGDSDLIGLARTLFSDPQWPRKVYEGKEDEISVCSCCNTCLMRVINNEPAICSRWDKLQRMDLDVRLKQKKMKWEKILIAVDDSERSLEAVEYAGHMIGSGKKVTLFSIVKNQREIEATIKAREALLIQAKGLLEATGMNERDIEIKVATEKKGIEQDVLDELERGEFGSIVLGRRGVSRAQQLLFGSISNYVVQHAKNCGVWVID